MEKVKLNRSLREAAKLTQDGLAAKLGVDRSTVTKWETGDALLRASLLPIIASIFGCSIDDLLCQNCEETPRANS